MCSCNLFAVEKSICSETEYGICPPTDIVCKHGYLHKMSLTKYGMRSTRLHELDIAMTTLAFSISVCATSSK